MARLDNWCVVYAPISPYHAPEIHYQRLQGDVTGREGIPDGSNITTSQIVGMYDENSVLTKSNNVYELGTIDPEYEKLYPDARKRLIKSLQEHEHE